MFGLGFGEILLLAAIGLIFIGPKELPQLAKILGRTIGELKKAINEVTATMSNDLTRGTTEDDRKTKEKKDPP